MKRLFATGATACALGSIAGAMGGQEAASVHLEAGCQHFLVDGASLDTDETTLRVPGHSCGLLMARGGHDVLPQERMPEDVASG